MFAVKIILLPISTPINKKFIFLLTSLINLFSKAQLGRRKERYRNKFHGISINENYK